MNGNRNISTSRFSRRTLAFLLLFVLCVGSRMLSTIYYIEDPDSLRFALGVVDYDVAALQPHFPGYPVFCFAVKLGYFVTSSFALGFSIVGGISLFLIILSLLRMLGRSPDSIEGGLLAFLVFANPFIWLMSNRYMPDLMGAACAIGAIALLLFGEHKSRRWGAFAAGLLMGIRLSYAPLVMVPLLYIALRHRRDLMAHAAMFLAGILIWFLPLIAITGWNDLLAAAQNQTSGHFEDFGGTVYTEPLIGLRLLRMTENILADGLGGYWESRSWMTIPITIGLALAFLAGCMIRGRDIFRSREWRIVWGGIFLYFLWILFFQNVIYQSRHILPLLPFLLVPVAIGCAILLGRRRWIGVPVFALFLGIYSALTGILVAQHKRPTAIAQVKNHLEENKITPSAQDDAGDLYIASVPLINYYLSAQGVRGIFLSVHDSAHRSMIAHPPPGGRLITIGDYRSLTGQAPAEEQIFYHNPFVNRVWPRVVVHEYR